MFHGKKEKVFSIIALYPLENNKKEAPKGLFSIFGICIYSL